MAAMLCDSVVAVVRTRPRAIPLAMITMRKSTHGFNFLPIYEYGAPLGGPSSCRSPAMKEMVRDKRVAIEFMDALRRFAEHSRS